MRRCRAAIPPSTTAIAKPFPILLLLLLLLPLFFFSSPARAAQQPHRQPACTAVLDSAIMEELPADRLAELVATAQALVAPGKGILVSGFPSLALFWERRARVSAMVVLTPHSTIESRGDAPVPFGRAGRDQ